MAAADAALPVSDILSSPPLSAASNPTATRVLLQAAATGTGGGPYYRALLGECIVYDDASNSILWVDIDGKSIHELSLLDMTTEPQAAGGTTAVTTYGPYPKK
eukprot:scaffold10386_cov29-Attheya_sp.AAC.1